jgi:hypothetical protein
MWHLDLQFLIHILLQELLVIPSNTAHCGETVNRTIGSQSSSRLHNILAQFSLPRNLFQVIEVYG